jgi:hypothetical protein
VELRWQRIEGEGVMTVVFVGKILRFESKIIILMGAKVRVFWYCGVRNIKQRNTLTERWGSF